ACVLSGDGHDVASVNVELLADIRKAFGDLDAITSADLVAALVADPERPWATWGKGDKPLTQSQLARLLPPFGIISETVHPAGRPHASTSERTSKKRGRPIVLVKIPLRSQLAHPKRAGVQVPMKWA